MLRKIKIGDCNYGYRRFPSHHVEYSVNVSVNHTYCSLLSSETYNAPSITISVYTPRVGSRVPMKRQSIKVAIAHSQHHLKNT